MREWRIPHPSELSLFFQILKLCKTFFDRLWSNTRGDYPWIFIEIFSFSNIPPPDSPLLFPVFVQAGLPDHLSLLTWLLIVLRGSYQFITQIIHWPPHTDSTIGGGDHSDPGGSAHPSTDTGAPASPGHPPHTPDLGAAGGKLHCY